MIATISGKRWRIVRADCGDAWGTCSNPDARGKAITIAPDCSGEKLLETLLHEALHAACWHLDEEFVTDYARDAARLATRMGFTDSNINEDS